MQGLAFDPYQVANSTPVATDRSISAFTGDIRLAATASDGDGDTLSYVWTQTAGDPVILDNAQSATPYFTANTSGSFSFNVRVRDWSGAYDDATVVVTIANAPVEPTFLGADSTTGPFWSVAGYGSSGYYIPAGQNGAIANTGSYPAIGAAGNYDLVSLPSGVAVTSGSEVHSWLWANPGSTSSRSIERPGLTGTVESCLWNETYAACSSRECYQQNHADLRN